MASLNRCIFRPTAGGTGTWTVSSAIAGYDTPAGCTNPAVVDGARYYYFAESDDQLSWEAGQGVYTVSGTTLTRETIYDSTNAGAAVNFTNAPRVAMGCPLAQNAGRELLTANRDYFVRTDGSDSNNGLANTAGGAFLTTQKAIDVIKATIDLGGFIVTIKHAAGTYTNTTSVQGPFVGAGAVTLEGDTTTPSNVLISTTSADCLTVTSGAAINIKGFKLATTTSGNGLSASTNGRISINGKMDFGAVVTAHMFAGTGAQINTGAQNYDITGGAAFHYLAQSGGQITDVANTITLTGTPAFSVAFAFADTAAFLSTFSQTFSGSATGTRYSISTGGVINTNGGGANYFPGNAAGSGGTTTGGGFYA